LLRIGRTDFDALAQRQRLTREPAPRQKFADHRHVRPIRAIALAQPPSRAQRNVQRGDVSGAYRLVQSRWLIAGLGLAALDSKVTGARVLRVRNRGHRYRRAHAWQRIRAFQHLPVEGRDLGILRVLVFGDGKAQSEHRVGFQALAIADQGSETAHHQAGARQQHHCQGNLPGHEQRTQPVPRSPQRRAAPAFFQGLGKIWSRGLPRGQEA